MLRAANAGSQATLGSPVERLGNGYPFFCSFFSRGTLPQKRAKGHYWGTQYYSTDGLTCARAQASSNKTKER